MSEPYKFDRSQALFERATQVIPCGIYGHVAPAVMLPGSFPYYAAKARGSHYWDVDGNEYIDYMCGYGPMVLGHQHPGVEEAAARQQRDALCLNHPGPVMVDLAEYLVDLVDFASWSVFGKNGSDMTTWAIQVAREHTHRKKVLKVAGGYHGIDPWCTPGHAGLIEEDRLHIHDFIWNDLNSFHDRLKEFRGQIAAVILCPFHHPAFQPSVLPADGFLKQIEEACRREGIVFILDDIRSGFRLHHGGSHRYFGFEPDIICFCKAIANGHALSAALGRKELRLAASKVFLTGSYWNSPPAMAAALACLKILREEKAVERMAVIGQKLMNGLVAAGAKHGYNMLASGPPALPLLTFADDPSLRRQQRFCAEATGRGAFFHPHHNWFVSAAHTEDDLAQTFRIADEAFAALRGMEETEDGSSHWAGRFTQTRFRAMIADKHLDPVKPEEPKPLVEEDDQTKSNKIHLLALQRRKRMTWLQEEKNAELARVAASAQKGEPARTGDLGQRLKQAIESEVAVEKAALKELEAAIARDPAAAASADVQRGLQMIHEGQTLRTTGVEVFRQHLEQNQEASQGMRAALGRLYRIEEEEMEKKKETLSHFHEFNPHYVYPSTPGAQEEKTGPDAVDPRQQPD